MKNNVNLLHDRRAYHLHVLSKKSTRTRRPNWACQEVAVHLAMCGLNHSTALHHPYRVRVLSILTPSIFCLVRSSIEGQRLAFFQLLQVFFFFFFSKAATETQPGDSARYWLSKADLKTLTLGSRFQVEILPTIVGKVANRETKWQLYQALFPTVVDPVAMRAWDRG